MASKAPFLANGCCGDRPRLLRRSVLSGAQGRFTSPDRPFADRHLADPQSWNLYSYSRNNPLWYIDDGGNEVKEAVHNVQYAVHGATTAEAGKNASLPSGSKSESGQPLSGDTTFTMTYTVNALQFSGTTSSTTATIQDADVILDQTVTVPVWAERDTTSSSDQTTWDAAAKQLADHEQEHVEVNRDAAHALDNSLPGTQGTGQGRAAAQNAALGAGNQKLDSAISKANAKHNDLDTRTDHAQKPDPKKDQD